MQRLTIVIADDEPIIRMDLRAMLTNAGYDVVGEGADGFEAIEKMTVNGEKEIETPIGGTLLGAL